MATHREWLTKEQAAAEFPFSERQLRRLREQRQINTYNFNGKGEYCFKRSELEALLEAGVVPAVTAEAS